MRNQPSQLGPALDPDTSLQGHAIIGRPGTDFAAQTLGDWLDYWVTYIAGRRARRLTLETYRMAIERHIKPSIGSVKLSALRAEHLDLLIHDLERKGLAPATCLRHYGVAARAVRVAGQRGYVERDLPSLVDPPRPAPRIHTQALTRDEARALLAAAAGRRNSARWTVALALGLRQSETLALRWSDFDENAGTLAIRRGLHRVTGVGLVYEEPKSARGRRTLVVPAPLIQQLGLHRLEQNRERETAGDRWTDNGLIFALRNGRPINRRNDWAEWKALLARAGVRDVRLHDARHTAASLLIAEGVHIRVLMDLLGHSQIRTTMETYGHVLPGLAQEAAQKMSRVLLE